MRSLLRVIYPLIIWAVSTFAAAGFVAANDGFGKGDIKGFSFISLFFSAVSLSLYGLFSKLFSRYNPSLSLVLTVLASVLQAIIFLYATWFVYGPWIGAFSFPIFYCWLTGTSAGNFYILVNSGGSFKIRHLAIVAGLVILVFTALYLVTFTRDSLSTNQNFDIICLKWTPSDKIPEVSDFTKFSLTESEAKEVLSIGLRGSFWSDKYFRIENSKLVSTDFPEYDFDNKDNGSEIEFHFGNRLDSTQNERQKVIVIMNHPQETSFSFKQPISKSLIVVQNKSNDQFRIYPDNIELNTKRLIIEGTDFRSFPHWTSIKVELKGRGDFSIHGFQWLKRRPTN